MTYFYWLLACFFTGWSSGLASAQAVLPPSKQAWQCTPCDKVCDDDTYAAPGACPHCGMALIGCSTATSLTQPPRREQVSQRDGQPINWPLPLELRVPFAPTAFPSGEQTHLLYELHLTNFGAVPLVLNRVEVFDAQADGGSPLVTFEAATLATMLQPLGGSASFAPGQPLLLAGGQRAIVFMALITPRRAQLPTQLRHRVSTEEAAVEGARISTHHTKLRLLAPPVAGANWLAADGPGNTPDNHHRRGVLVLGGEAVNSRRFAIDWKQVQNGHSFAGATQDLHAYYCYGQPVRAVANSRVVAVHDGQADNVPGHGSSFHPAVPITLETVAGNTIVLALGNGQFAHYLHLQSGSLRVRVGEQVRRGQVLAHIGSSGDAREPHLHFEVTTSPTLLQGEGIPYLLRHYRSQPTPIGSLERHQRELPLDRSISLFE
jgi:murein DD-endopeptidase MepM/ murein hydrolase activator NlpD